MKTFRSDLHVHTVLSPCAEVEMIPPLIVESALDLGIDLIAITDHNSTANIKAVQTASQNSNLTVLPGMEVQTREDIHSLCIFDTLDQALTLQEAVDATLPAMKNEAEYFGEQFVVDESGEFIRREEQLLITASSLSLSEVWKIVSDLGGLFIPAHIDRKTYGLINTLGFVPFDIPFEALEISRHISVFQAIEAHPSIRQIPIIQNGDVHRLNEFLGSSHFTMEYPSISELRMALKKQNGRFFEVRT